jgi:ATP/ADP translocase
MKKAWEIWKYAIGSFSDDKTAPYDNYVAGIRTIIFVSYMVTNAFIVSGVIRHWNDVSSSIPQTQEKGFCKAPSNFYEN